MNEEENKEALNQHDLIELRRLFSTMASYMFPNQQKRFMRQYTTMNIM